MPYARLLERPQFTTVDGLEATAAKLPTMEKLPLYVRVERRERPYARRMAVLNTATQAIVGDVDPGFKMVQHADVLRKVGEGVKGLGFPFAGGTAVSGDGTYATGVVAFLDDEAPDSDPDHPVGHPFQMAVEWRNALDASGALSLNGVAIRKVCTNGRIARDILGSWVARHTNGVEELLQAIPQHVVETVDKSGAYERLWEEADQEQVVMNHVPLLLKAVGMPDRGIMDVVSNIFEFEPSARERLTRARLHEAANYWINHLARGEVRRGQTLVEKVHVLMETNLDRLLAKVTGAN